jgi:hypothetical protein
LPSLREALFTPSHPATEVAGYYRVSLRD